MTGLPTLGVVATGRLDDGAFEFLRLCTGFVAGGGALTLVEIGKGAGLFSRAKDLPVRAEQNLDGLASFDVTPHRVDAAELRDLLLGSGRFFRVADPARTGTPELVVVDAAWLADASDASLVHAFEEAGQLIRG